MAMDPHDAMLLTYRPTTVVSQGSRLNDTCPDLCGSSEDEEGLFAPPSMLPGLGNMLPGLSDMLPGLGDDEDSADSMARDGMFAGDSDLAGPLGLPDKLFGLPTVPVIVTGVAIVGVIAFLMLRKKK